MSGIRIGDLGNRVAPVVPSDRAPAQAFVTGDGGSGAALAAIADAGLQEQAQQREAAQKAARAAMLQDVVGKATREVSELELTFERDPEYSTQTKRFEEGSKKVSEKYTAAITDPVVRQAFAGEYQKIELSKLLNVQKGAVKKETDYNRASLDTNLATYADAAATAQTPQERDLMLRQGQIAITTMQTGGWIDAEEAGKRSRAFLSRMDDAQVRRDISADPLMAATNLSMDPEYGKNLDPVARQRWVDTAYRRAETEGNRLDREEGKRKKERGDEMLSEGYSRLSDGKLTREYIEQARPFISPAEYKGLLEARKKQGQSGEDNRAAFADLQKALYANPQDATTLAFSLHSRGLIKDGTLKETLSKARDLSRTEGPKSAYERNRQFITTSLDPGALSSDPAPKARMGLAVKEYDDWAAEILKNTGKEPDDKAVETRAKEVVKRYSLIDMNELARSTGIGAQPTPEAQLESVKTRAEKLQADLAAGTIKEAEFKKKMAELNRLRKAAEKASGNGKP